MKAYIEVHTPGGDGPQFIIVDDVDRLIERIESLSCLSRVGHLQGVIAAYGVEWRPEHDQFGSEFRMVGDALHVCTYSDSLPPDSAARCTSAWIEGYDKHGDVDSIADLHFDTDFWKEQLAKARAANAPYVILGDGLDVDAILTDQGVPG